MINTMDHINQTSNDVNDQSMISKYELLREPADRLGKVVFANEVSIGCVGGGGCPGGPKSHKISILGDD